MYYLLYGHIDKDTRSNFLKISNHFPKNLQKFSEGDTNIFEQFPKISKGWKSSKNEEMYLYWTANKKVISQVLFLWIPGTNKVAQNRGTCGKVIWMSKLFKYASLIDRFVSFVCFSVVIASQQHRELYNCGWQTS